MLHAVDLYKSCIGMPGVRIKIQSRIIEFGYDLKLGNEGLCPIMDGNMRDGEVEAMEQEALNGSGRHIGVVI